jgi:hypothetical protein
MESNMRGFKFYEKHCARTIISFILFFICLFLIWVIDVRTDNHIRWDNYQEERIERLNKEIYELILQK